jgi:hypothetical protein
LTRRGYGGSILTRLHTGNIGINGTGQILWEYFGSISCAIGTRALSPGVKLQGSEDDHSLSTNVEVKKTWIYTSTTPYVFMA